MRAISMANVSVSRGPILTDDFIQARFLSSFLPAVVLSAHHNACPTKQHAKGNLLPRFERAGLEGGYGDQLFFQCSRSLRRTRFASQYRMNCMCVSLGHVFIGVTGDVRRPANQLTTLLSHLRRGGIGLQNLW